MENGFPYGDIIFLALIAAFVLLRLRSTLGKNTGFDGSDTPRPPAQHMKADDIVQRVEKIARTPTPDEEEAVLATIADEHVKQQLVAMRGVDGNFSPKEFLHGARGAFDMVLDAFNDGAEEPLKMLLSPALFATFDDAIKQRASQPHKHESTLVAIKSADITGAELKDKHIAQITVKFVSEQIHVTRDAEGAIIEGNPSATVQVEDAWTFERDLRSKHPNWTVIDT